MVEPYDLFEDRELTQYTGDGKRIVRQHIVKEAPLTIMLNGEKLATLLCSPHSFEVLALGFLVNEGVLHRRDELKSIFCRSEQGVVWVETTSDASRGDGFLNRQPVPHLPQFTLGELLGFVARLNEEAHTFKLTGGVHEAALAHRAGFVVCYEDIGRHNALDRVLGYTFLNDIDTSDKAVILSGRIASEMLAKAARIGVPVVVSRSAPTCLSIDMAERLGMTLVGFTRNNSLSVYTHPDRIVE